MHGESDWPWLVLPDGVASLISEICMHTATRNDAGPAIDSLMPEVALIGFALPRCRVRLAVTVTIKAWQSQ